MKGNSALCWKRGRLSGGIIVIALGGFLVACGGGGGTAATGPTVTAVSPPADTTGVAPTTTATAVFSEDMFASTINDGTFTVGNGNGAVAGTVSFDAIGNVATFTPTGRLALLQVHTASLSAGITNLAGSALAPISWSFTVGEGAWGTPALIETYNGGSATYPDIAMDAGGNALAVWSQSDSIRQSIWANRYTVGSGWGTAQLIETDDAGNAGSSCIAMDGSGNALAVWSQSDGTRQNIWSNRYTAGSGWGTAVLIETGDAGNAFNPEIAMDASGNALAVWNQFDGIRDNIWSNRYTVGSGWSAAELIETFNTGGTDLPRIAMDAGGNALAVWSQSDGTRYNIWFNRYTVGSGWGTAQLIETNDTSHAFYPDIAVDGSGNGVAVWKQNDGTRYNIWSNRYTVGSGWGTAQLIETDNAGPADLPRIAMDGSGNGLAVWHQSDGTRYNIWSNRYTAGSGWGAAQLLESDDVATAAYPEIAMDPGGNALTVWSHWDGIRANIWSSRYRIGSGWGTAQLIETDDAGDALSVQITMGSSGNALAVWGQSNGAIDNIWSNRFE
ncbi:MAG: hypothetical protein CVV05_12515 [Gammaproteobacteria bacterium HGW-Gammaproteobacteria-1]|jgi:uncharacterized protein YbdZ (MbtH family)|nr:MAG: hypothetical protein CVV05_12515 [Gammaproteobacteria bacterium HGW-Gammaproteobacteria-1]